MVTKSYLPSNLCDISEGSDSIWAVLICLESLYVVLYFMRRIRLPHPMTIGSRGVVTSYDSLHVLHMYSNRFRAQA